MSEFRSAVDDEQDSLSSTLFPWEDDVFPFDDIPDRITITPGPVTFEIKDITVLYSKADEAIGKKARKMFVAKCQVIEPADSVGLVHSIMFLLGTVEDPAAKNPETLRRSRNAVDFRNLLVAAKVARTPGQKDSDLFRKAEGCQFVTEIFEKDGYTRNKGYWPVGTSAAQMGVKGGARSTTRPTTLRPPVAQPPTVPSQAMLTCPTCSESVSRSSFGEHRKTHQVEQEAAELGAITPES